MVSDVEEYNIKCNDILSDPEIRFCGLIGKEGKLIAGGFRPGIEPLETDEERLKMYNELALRISKRKEFDSNLGRVKYSASRREKVVMMSFPIAGRIILVTAEPNVNIDRLAYKIIEKLGQQWYDFYGL